MVPTYQHANRTSPKFVKKGKIITNHGRLFAFFVCSLYTFSDIFLCFWMIFKEDEFHGHAN